MSRREQELKALEDLGRGLGEAFKSIVEAYAALGRGIVAGLEGMPRISTSSWDSSSWWAES